MTPRSALDNLLFLCILRSTSTLLTILLITTVSLPASTHSTKYSTVLHTDKEGRIGKTPENSRYLSDRVIVKLRESPAKAFGKSTSSLTSLTSFVQRYSAVSVTSMFPEVSPVAERGEMDLNSYYVIQYTSPVDAFAVAAEISNLDEVEYAEPWFIYQVSGEIAFTPNDSLYSRQWGLPRIAADSAWDVGQGDSTIVLGFVDTGVQLDHPDLAANIWNNPGEVGLDNLGRDKRTNGVDDDGNGRIDDWRGWDFVGADFNAPNGDNNPSPTAQNNSHGTHIAGIAAAVTDNNRGVAGVGFRCKILAVKATADNDTRGQGGSAFIIAGYQGMVYASQMGAKAINCSWGGEGYSQFEQDVVNYVTQRGALVVAAAGNSAGTNFSYPASYTNVISVAATDRSDRKPGYSSYGTAVDVSAPGGAPTASDHNIGIFSTAYPSTYGVAVGTSQATPHVTGLAGLVAARFPSYSPIQIGEQIRVTCDDISSSNPSFFHLLGKGRINARRALSDSLRPAIRVTALSIRDSLDGNNNREADPGETIDLVITYTNYLHPTSSSAVFFLSSTDTSVQVLQGTYAVGSVGRMEVGTNSSNPFRIRISPSVRPSTMVRFEITMTDGGFDDFQYFTLLVNPAYATQRINNVEVTFTNNGRIGFDDFPGNQRGVGFVYGGLNHLFEGGLLIGTSSTKLVNCVRNSTQSAQDQDFRSNQVYRFETPGTVSDQDGRVTFTDIGAPSTNRIGVEVRMHSYAFVDPPDRDYVIVRYDIKNTSGGTLSNLYVGLYFDWDMRSPDPVQDSTWQYNKTAFDAGKSLGYAWYDTTIPTVHCGVRALDGAASYRGLTSSQVAGTRSEKWSWLSGGIRLYTATNDINFAISSGPFTIAEGATRIVGFAIVGGADLARLHTNADAAAAKWAQIKSIIGVRPKLTITVHQNTVLTRYADFYVSSDAALASTPTMVVETGPTSRDTVRLTSLVPNLYKGSYEFTASGTRTIRVTGIGSNGLDTVVTRTVQVQLVKRGEAIAITEPGSGAILSIPVGVFSEDSYVTAHSDGMTPTIERPLGVSSSFGPAKKYPQSMTISFPYEPGQIPVNDIRSLRLFQRDDSSWIELRSRVDTERHFVYADVYSLGTFALGISASPDAGHTNTALPVDYALDQNYPNPFNPWTEIRFALPERGRVRMRVLNVLGQEIRELINGDRGAGFHSVEWDATDGDGNPVASGVYLYTIEVSSGDEVRFRRTEKMVVLK